MATHGVGVHKLARGAEPASCCTGRVSVAEARSRRVQPIRFSQRRVEPDWWGVRSPKPTRSVGGNPRGEAAGFKLSAELVRTWSSRGRWPAKGGLAANPGREPGELRVRSLVSCAAVE